MTAIEAKVKKSNITEVPQSQLNEELGDTGTIITRGILSQQDYNPDLTGPNRIKKYDEMRLGDATVRGLLHVVKLPVLNAEWYIKPVSDETKDVEIKQFVESELLKNSGFGWNALLNEVLTFCEYGNSIWEKVFRIIPDGDFKGKIGWEKFGHRLSKTILRWAQNDGSPGIVQMLPVGKTEESMGEANKGKTQIDIPKWKLLYFILEKEGSNYEGISMLRSAYKHWYYKDNYYKIDAVATERHGLGLPIVTSPPQASAADKRKAALIAKNIRANSQSYADLPTGFKLEFVDMKSNTLKDCENMVLHHDRQISKSVLAEFLELGAKGASGSYSMSSTQADLFYLSEEYIARLVRDEFQKAIKELVDLNYGSQKDYPSLEFGNIGQINPEMLAKALQQLTQGGIIVPDKELERHVRQVMHLPEATYIEEQEDGKDTDGDGTVGKKPDAKTQKTDPTTGKPKPETTDPKDKMKKFVEDAEVMLQTVNKVIHAKEKRSGKTKS